MFGKYIKTQLKKHEMTHDDLAAALNFDRSLITKWCSGKRIPSDEAIKKMASLFNEDVDHLFKVRQKIINERKDMNNKINERFQTLTDKKVEDFVHDILLGFRYDDAYLVTIQYLTINYLTATVLSELEYRDRKMEEGDIFDIYNLISDLEHDAINNKLYKNFVEAYGRFYDLEGSERDAAITKIYERDNFIFNDLSDDIKAIFRFTLLRLADHIIFLINNPTIYKLASF